MSKGVEVVVMMMVVVEIRELLCSQGRLRGMLLVCIGELSSDHAALLLGHAQLDFSFVLIVVD